MLLIYIIKISHFPQYCTQLFTNQMAVTNNTTTSEQCENPVVYTCLIHLCLSESKIYGYSSFSIVTTYKRMVMFMARLTHTYSFRHIDVIKMHAQIFVYSLSNYYIVEMVFSNSIYPVGNNKKEFGSKSFKQLIIG